MLVSRRSLSPADFSTLVVLARSSPRLLNKKRILSRLDSDYSRKLAAFLMGMSVGKPDPLVRFIRAFAGVASGPGRARVVRKKGRAKRAATAVAT